MSIVCPHCGKPINEPEPVSGFPDADVVRFWKTVDKNYTSGCWLSTAIPSGKYGRNMMGGKLTLAHVVSWIIHNGAIPPGQRVCHRCDVPRCVRPDHLFLGTNKQNMEDMVAKGRCRPPMGEKSHFAKLTADDAVRIREAIASGQATIQQLAEQYKTSFQGIYHVARGQVWSHVGGPLLLKRPCRTLSTEEVLKIRAMATAGERVCDISKQFGIHQATISNIIHFKKRKDVLPCPTP